VTAYKSIRNLSACVEKRGESCDGWLVAIWEGGWYGEEEGEIEEERVGRVWIYWLLPMDHRRIRSVGIPLVILIVNASHHYTEILV